MQNKITAINFGEEIGMLMIHRGYTSRLVRDGPLESDGGGGDVGGKFSACTSFAVFLFTLTTCGGFFSGETLCMDFFFFRQILFKK